MMEQTTLGQIKSETECVVKKTHIQGVLGSHQYKLSLIRGDSEKKTIANIYFAKKLNDAK